MIFNSIVIFLREVKVEIQKVSFLKREELIKHTVTVIAISIIFSLFLGGLDYLFNGLINKIIFR